VCRNGAYIRLSPVYKPPVFRQVQRDIIAMDDAIDAIFLMHAVIMTIYLIFIITMVYTTLRYTLN